ncbi:MAG: hypothetical protein HWE22_15690 [Flavobacteriales bacterium]|nr:hypothetical protein [Flavobacteriales bacterium]
MKKSNVPFFEEQTKAALNQLLNVEYDQSMFFLLELDQEDKSDLKTNFDEIMNFWVLPEQIEKKFRLHEIAEILTTPRNEIPLWIKLSEEEKGQTYKMSISRRFRKLRVIRERHEYSPTLPFIQ